MSEFTIKSIAGIELWRGSASDLRAAVVAAVDAGANLAGANLAGANLAGADLTEANLAGANLAGANLPRVNLAGANLAGANLAGANLAWANLPRANLAGANLPRVNLAGANLARANLAGANLAWANLPRANLAGANLPRGNLARADITAIRADLRAVLDAASGEALGLRDALRRGNVDGSAYEGQCACLVGTIANVRQCDYRKIPSLAPNADRPAERWFLAIRPGDNARNSQVVSITLGWLDEWLAEKGIRIPKRPKAVGEVSRLMARMTAKQRKAVLAFARSQ